jgi:histidinol-phosphate aminotransferase
MIDVSNLVRPEIQALSAYHVPTAANYIKLDAMENPYRWSETLIAQWLETLKSAEINRYPDPNATALKQDLRAVMQIPQPAEIILGNGSDELIQMLLLTFNYQGRAILSVEPSFTMYRLLAQVIGMPYIGVPLQADDFTLDMPALRQVIIQQQPALIFLAYPNNPTGNGFARHEIVEILQISTGIVVIDEAYAPFADDTFMGELGNYPNLLVMRTVSKLGLAGLRLGVLAGAARWLQQIEKTRLPYNINVLTQLSARFALQHYAVLVAQTEQIRRDRALLLQQLRTLPAVRTWESQANFLLFRVSQAGRIFEGLKSHGILIKNLHGFHPLTTECLRVTVGSPEENQAFLSALQQLG